MTRITVNGVGLNVESAGSGPPLVLLHGFTGSGETWKSHAEAYADRFTVITIDILGHGGSDSPDAHQRYAMEYIAEDLIAIFNHLKLERVHLLGYSMGGRVALHMGIRHSGRIASLILESASPGIILPELREARIRDDEVLAERIEREGIEAFVDHWENLPMFASQLKLPETVRAGLRAQRLRNNPTGLANSLRGMGTGVQFPLWWHLENLACPTLLIAGALDNKFTVTAKAMFKKMPNGRLPIRLVIVPEAGHTVHLEQPETFNRLVLEFLDQHARN